MDNQNLVLLSKFSVSARRLIGAVNPAKLLKDNEYSAEIFNKVFELGDEELITLSLQVQNMLDQMSVSATATSAKVVSIKPVIVTATDSDIKSAEQKYMFGARS